MKRLHEAYPKDVVIGFRHFPLGFHEQAGPAAEAAYAAHQQGKFWEYHDRLFERQQALSEETYAAIATDLALDMSRFNRDRNSQQATSQIRLDLQIAQLVAANGTPAFMINGQLQFGALPYETIQQAVVQQMKVVNQRIADKKEETHVARATVSDNNLSRAQRGISLVPVDGAPTRGKNDALITAVVFSDFQ